MNTVLQFLRECETYYLATIDGDKPRVRPFGAVSEFDGKMYFCTNNQKDVYKQMRKHPAIEFSGTLKNGAEWIRLEGKAVFDSRIEAKEEMLKQNPSLNALYKADDEIFEVFYLENATAHILSFAGRNDAY
ncbi:pyridoxamine 5'-phosphate oxidase family protein, partial [Christensenellaceae bacterium OttesenSCG-928-M15]|nr:pyridoxamine 5'-phosphate oxidase family protein [Christensenellaceae bacterium OttesenSCG-928-M15]